MTLRRKLFKVLCEDGTAPQTGYPWPLDGTPLRVEGQLVPCEHGLHVCRAEDLVLWLGPVIWRVEVRGEIIEAADKIVVREARLVERLTTWNERTARLFAADCAEHVLSIYEAQYPDDDRPRQAIAAARAYSRGEIGTAAASAAASAADAAAASAAASAADAATWAAAASAAASAADAATWAAAASAADAATWAAAWAAGRDAARAAERAWQTDRLFDYLEGRA